MSLNYLQAQAQTIRQQLQALAPNSIEFQQLRNQLLVVQAQLGAARGSIQSLTF